MIFGEGSIDLVGVLLALATAALPVACFFVVLYFVIRNAVLSALRTHDTE